MFNRLLRFFLKNQQFNTLYNTIRHNAFLKSSGIIFVVNIIAATLNYSIPIIVRNISEKDFFPSWIALNSTVAITMVVFTALQAEFTKKTSALANRSTASAIGYLQFMQRGLLKTFFYSIPFLPIFIYIIHIVNPAESWILAITIVGNLFFQAYAVLHSSFLMGLLKLKDFSINLLLATLSRPIITTLLLLAGFGLYALPLGYIFFALVMLVHAILVITKIDLNKLEDSSLKAEDIGIDPLSLRKEIWSTAKTILVFFVLSAFLNASAIISERVLENQDKDLFAVLFTFGQIMHFGAISFLGAFVAYSAKGRNLKLYLTSITAVTLITLTVGVGFWLFGPLLLLIMNSSEYFSQIPIILYFSIFIALYNIIFVSAQYLVSLNDYRTIAWLFLFLISQIWILFNPYLLGKNSYDLFTFISINIIFSLIASIIIGGKTIFDHRRTTVL